MQTHVVLAYVEGDPQNYLDASQPWRPGSLADGASCGGIRAVGHGATKRGPARCWLARHCPDMLINMGTGEWIVAAVETTADEAADRIDIRIAGPFVDQEAADKFAAEAEREGLVVEVSRMYAPERGVEEFAIGNR